MKATIITLNQLGTNCWSAKRFINSCYKCTHYRCCEYPERVSNKGYDSLQTDIYHKTETLATAKRKLREFIKQ